MAPHYYITRNLLLVKAPGILIVRLTRQFLEDNVFYSDHRINRSQENKGSSPTDWKSYTCIPARDIKNSTCTAQKSHEAKRCTTQDTINLGVLTQHGCWDFSTLCTNTYSMPGQINLPNLSTLPEILYPILIPKYNK